MSRILILQNPKGLKALLRKLPASPSGGHKFLNLGDMRQGQRELLKQYGLQEISVVAFDHTTQERFLREYIDLVGVLGQELNSKEWWAGYLASKNRFSSNLAFLLQQFMMAVDAAQNENYDHLFVLNPSWVILDSLEKALIKRRSNFIIVKDHFQKWEDVGRIWGKTFLLALRDSLKIGLQTLRVRLQLRPVLKSLPFNKPFYVIKTFIYDHSLSDAGVYRDAFFGSLPEFIKKKKPVLIYGHLNGDYFSMLSKIRRCSSPHILPIEAFLSPTDPVKAVLRLLFCKIRVQKEADFWGHDVSDIINTELFRTHNNIPFNQWLHYQATRKLVKTLPVETFLLTYENNPWEKMCIMALRKYSPETTVIGYQHTVVPQASANMFHCRKEKDIMPMPDRILTVGERPKEIMEKYGAYETIRIEPACGLRFEYLFQTGANPRQKSGHILVVLEGIFDVYKMVNYVLRELRGTPYQATIRTHPVLPLDGIRHKLEQRPEETPNFRISSGRSLKEDIQDADMIIYWGSTVALEALSLGKPVIHFAMDSVLSFDPLFECKHLKWVVSANDSLVSAIEEIYALNDERFEEERKKAKAYLSRYFFPVTDESLAKFL